ncbi:MAG TPA: hypothetical protein VMJ10_00920 [Kofleriaceae bacterium]|nr:hypothetical protein [Kofleriaceae bacterium]
MGTAAPALTIALCAVAAVAHADPCTGTTDAGARFATCFDPGNRLVLDAATSGFGGGIAIRHDITFEDEPDLIWKMSHELANAEWAPLDNNRFDGLLYRGIYVRHSRDGHVVLPTDPPKKIFLPFDIGALVEVGRLETHSPTSATLGIVETAALVDLARSRSARWRAAIGPSASWRVELDRMPLAISDHAIAPFSSLLVDLHGESDDGLWIGEARGEAGYFWHLDRGWLVEERAEASLERVVLAIDDRPVALYAAVRYESAYAETIAGLGVRFAVFDRADPRVSLHPPQ